MPLRVVAGPGAQGRPFKLVKSTQTGKTAAETARTTVSKDSKERSGLTRDAMQGLNHTGPGFSRLRRAEKDPRGPYIVGQACAYQFLCSALQRLKETLILKWVWLNWARAAWRSIVVGVTGFKLTISMCSLIRRSCNLVEVSVLFKVLYTCVPKDFVGRCFVAEK